MLTTNYDEIAKRFTVPAGKRKQKGRIPRELAGSKVGREVIKQPYRSFAHEREHQILRHVATQLFHAIKNENIDETEIQVMHFRGSLFISSNKSGTGQKILKLIKDKGLQEVLTTTYKPHLIEGRMRSNRYAKKLEKRVFGKEISIPVSSDKRDSEMFKSVAEIVKTSQCKSLDLTNPEAVATALSKRQLIHIITNRPGFKGPNPHAEEFLVDIRNFVDDKNEHSAIAGKKRPCFGCSGSMKGHIDNYNSNPGYFWLDTIKHKSEPTAHKIIALLKEKHTYVSVCKEKKENKGKKSKTTTEYDSGSDSECEEEGRTNSKRGSSPIK